MQSKEIGGTQSVREVDCLRFEQGDVGGAKVWVEQDLALFPYDPQLLFRAGTSTVS